MADWDPGSEVMDVMTGALHDYGWRALSQGSVQRIAVHQLAMEAGVAGEIPKVLPAGPASIPGYSLWPPACSVMCRLGGVWKCVLYV